MVDGDIRWYQRLGGSGLLALRLKGFKSWGDNPDFFFYGGNSEMRGYEYLEFAGHQGVFANAELRFPLIEAMLTPIGVLGGIRGVFFANIGGSHFNGQPFKFATSGDEQFRRCSTSTARPIRRPCVPIYGPAQTISGFRLRDGRASYGVGLESFLLGFPIHFDFAWRTLFNKDWEDALFAGLGRRQRVPQAAVQGLDRLRLLIRLGSARCARVRGTYPRVLALDLTIAYDLQTVWT